MNTTATPTDSQQIVVDYSFTVEEAARATAAITRESIGRLQKLSWLGAFLLLVAFAAILAVPGGWRGAWFPAVFGLFFLLGPTAIARATVRREFSRMPSQNAPIRWRITCDELVLHGPNGTDRLEWRSLSKVRETKHGILFFIGPTFANWLPLHALKTQADLDLLRSWIAEKRGEIGTSPPAAAPLSSSTPPASFAPHEGISVVGSYIYTSDEADRSRRAVAKAASPWSRVLPWSMPAIVLGYAAWSSSRNEDWTVLIGAAVIMPLVAWFTVSRIRKARADAFARSPDANCEVKLTVSVSGIDIRGDASTSSYTWKNVIKARETKDGFLLYLQPRIAQWLPARAFSSTADLELIRSWIAQHGIEFKRI